MFDDYSNVISFQRQLCPDLPFDSVRSQWPEDKAKAVGFVVSNFTRNYDKVINGQICEDDKDFNLYPTVDETMALVAANFGTSVDDESDAESANDKQLESKHAKHRRQEDNDTSDDDNSDTEATKPPTNKQIKRKLEDKYDNTEEKNKETPTDAKKARKSPRTHTTTPASSDPPSKSKKASTKPNASPFVGKLQKKNR
jgi:hypothetical protein